MLAHSDTEEVRTVRSERFAISSFVSTLEFKRCKHFQGTMKIEDVEYAVVKEMLQFIYTGRCSADMHDMCSDLLIAADKYGYD